jgi:outer membrane protein OmpA-like peptidoglycan-associated protein
MRHAIAGIFWFLTIVSALDARGDHQQHARAVGLSDGPVPLQGAAKGPKLEVSIDRAKVDLAGRRLEVKLNRPAEKVRLKVIGESGAVLAEVEQKFGGAAPGTPLVVGWEPSSAEAVARIEVWGHDTGGFYAGVAIQPWSVNIGHEEVNFQTDSDVIRPSETPKLEASFKKINEAIAKFKGSGAITLFVVGHTDTVGAAEYNLTLSRRRARSIASWFKTRGLRIPVGYEGLGESAPLVKTADETDEPRNRRVDYILALEPPKLPSSGAFSWKSL